MFKRLLSHGIVAGLMAGAALADEPDMSEPMTANASWLVGEFERRYQDEAALVEDIGRLFARDQYVRHLIIDIFQNEQMTLEDREGFIRGTEPIFERVDEENTEALKTILESYTWEDLHRIDPELLSQAFHIVQHSNDTAFQADTLAEFEPLALSGEIDQQAYAMLYDRVTLGEGGQQRYGTQYECLRGEWQVKALEAPETVDERREAFGMEPLEDYLEHGKALYGECPDE